RLLGYQKEKDQDGRLEPLERFIERVLGEVGGEVPSDLHDAIVVRNNIAHELPDASTADAMLVVRAQHKVFRALLSAHTRDTEDQGSAEAEPTFIYNGPTGPAILTADAIAKLVNASWTLDHEV